LICRAAQVREYNFGVGETITAFVAFDSINKRYYHRELITTQNPGRKFYASLFLYNQHEFYKTDSVTGKCYKARIPTNKAWRPFGVPENASFYQQINIGPPNAAVLANEYVIREADHPNGFYYRGTFSAAECVPIEEMTIKKEGLDISQSDIQSYYDTVLGIANPNVFNVPVTCINATYSDYDTVKAL